MAGWDKAGPNGEHHSDDERGGVKPADLIRTREEDPMVEPVSAGTFLTGRRTFLRLTGGGIAATFLASCVGQPSDAPSDGQDEDGGGPRRGGTLRVGLVTAIENFDPHTITAFADRVGQWNIFSGLTSFDPESRQFLPDIAESITEADDRLSWTFKIRKGIQFHNGRELTAEDVRLNLQRILDPATQSFYAETKFGRVRDVTVDSGSNSVIIALDQPDALVPSSGFVTYLSIMPPETFDDANAQPVGSGPFQFVSHQPGTETVLKRWPGYGDDGVYLDELRFFPVPEDSSRVAALVSGELDWIDAVPLARVEELSSNPDLNVMVEPSSWIDYFDLNIQRPPLDNKRVRQAIAHAVNRQGVNDNVLFGLGEQVDTNVPAASPVEVKAPALPYDPELARQILEEEGVVGFDLPILAQNTGHLVQTAEAIASDLQAVGINAQPMSTESGIWTEQVRAHSHMAAISAAISGIDPHDRTYNLYYTGAAGNYAEYSDPRVDELLDQGLVESDTTKRGEIYSEAWTIINDDVPRMHIVSMPQAVASRKEVTGFVPYPERNTFFDTVSKT